MHSAENFPFMIRIGLVGYGYWGPNLARNFAELTDAQLVAVADLRPERRELAARRHPGIRTTANFLEVIHDPQIEAVAIATPVSTHYELASAALSRGKHIWLEKPFTETADQARRLRDEAARLSLVLTIDHTFLFTPAVRKIRELVHDDRLGDVLYYDSVRVNLGLVQEDVNVVFDLAVHDLSIMDYVLPRRVEAVSATGIAHLDGRPETQTYITCFFDSNLIGHVHVNWLAPVKIRRTLIGGSRRMIVYDDVEPSEKVKIYDAGVDITKAEPSDPDSDTKILVAYRTGDVWTPNLERTEALKTEAEHFCRCIMAGETPLSGADQGIRIMELIEATNTSLASRGAPVEIPPVG